MCWHDCWPLPSFACCALLSRTSLNFRVLLVGRLRADPECCAGCGRCWGRSPVRWSAPTRPTRTCSSSTSQVARHRPPTHPAVLTTFTLPHLSRNCVLDVREACRKVVRAASVRLSTRGGMQLVGTQRSELRRVPGPRCGAAKTGSFSTLCDALRHLSIRCCSRLTEVVCGGVNRCGENVWQAVKFAGDAPSVE